MNTPIRRYGELVVDALTRYLEMHPADTKVWSRLAETYAEIGDAHGELHARFQVAEAPKASLAEINLAANRFNALAASSSAGGSRRTPSHGSTDEISTRAS